MVILAYFQHINHAYIVSEWVGWWVGESENVQKPAYVIFEWSLSEIESSVRHLSAQVLSGLEFQLKGNR